jgi:hypothetical protein
MVNLDIVKGEGIKYELIPYRAEDDVTVISVFEGERKQKMLEYLDGIAAIIKDEREHINYFKGWCPHMSCYYAENPLKGNGMERLYPSKNVFGCEAHCELALMNYTILINGEEELASEYWEKVQKLMVMPV